MKFTHPIKVTEIAKMINANITGDIDQFATGINEIHKVTAGDIAFVDVAKYFDKTLNSAATVIILNQEVPCPEGKTLLILDKPFEAYNALVLHYRPFQFIKSERDNSTKIHPTAIIEPGVIIGPDVEIGAHSHIQANVVLSNHVTIGERVIIQSGAVIGTDAFYFKKENEVFAKWHSCGRVIIEDDVYIGANCTINKGVSGDTIIGAGSKLDCLVHIGHGVIIGKNCLLAAQVGISGKTILGDGVTLYGQVGLAQNLHIGAGATVLAKSGVGKSLDALGTYFGTPAGEVRTKMKEIAAMQYLPELVRKMNT